MTGVVRDVLRNGRLALIVCSYAAFVLAEYATWIAVTVIAFERGGATEAGLVALAQLVPAALAAPVLGKIAEQRSPLASRIAGHVVQTVGLALAAAAALGDMTLLVYAGAVLTSIAVVTTRPTQAALLPGASETPEQLTGANVALGWVENAGIAAAGLLAGVLLAVADPWLTLAVGAVLTGVAGAVVLPLHRSRSVTTAPMRESAEHPAESLLRNSAAVVLLSMLMVQWLLVGALDVLYVVLAVDMLEAGEAWVGYLQAAFGLGALAAAGGATLLVGRRLGVPIVLCALAQTVVLALVAATDDIWMVAFLLGGVGAGRAVLDIAGRTLLQRAVSPHLLPRTFGALEGVSMAGRAVGSVLVPLLVLLEDTPAVVLGVAAVLLAGLALGGWSLLSIDARADVPVVEITLLRQLRLFSHLAPPALEAIARALVRRDLAPGEAGIREGELGESYFVIGSGAFEVTRGGRSLGLRHRGDGVGEIALLREIPRTASVTAVSAGTLYELPREPFLTAVAGHALTQQQADLIVDERLRDEDPAGPGQ